MDFIKQNRGNIFLTVLVVVLGAMIGVLLYGRYHTAEAVIGGTGNVTLANSPHNFAWDSAAGSIKAISEGRICIFCHTPHNSITDASLINAPLWNHTLSSATYTVKSPGLYNTPTGSAGFVNMLTSPPTQPDGASKLCLSCHDGTVSIGSISSGSAISMDTSHACLDADGSLKTGCTQTIGLDLTTKHVVSIPMNATLKGDSAGKCDGSQTTKLQFPWEGATGQPTSVILRPTGTLYGASAGISTGFPGSTGGKYRDGNYYGIQCSTCHDPHDWTDTADQNVAGYKFLVIGFNLLCQACHIPC